MNIETPGLTFARTKSDGANTSRPSRLDVGSEEIVGEQAAKIEMTSDDAVAKKAKQNPAFDNTLSQERIQDLKNAIVLYSHHTSAADLSQEGKAFARRLVRFMHRHITRELEMNEAYYQGLPSHRLPLIVYSSTLPRALQTVNEVATINDDDVVDHCNDADPENSIHEDAVVANTSGNSQSTVPARPMAHSKAGRPPLKLIWITRMGCKQPFVHMF